MSEITNEKNIDFEKINDHTKASSNSKDSTKSDEENHLLNRKVKRSNKKTGNKDLCEICRDGGELILCDNCPRSFHAECLKLKKSDIPEGNWYCSICKPIMQKKLEKNNLEQNKILSQEDLEREKKRLLKNQKRRLWRLKKKAELNEMKKKLNSNNHLINKEGNTLIDTFLFNNKNNKIKYPLDNSNICLNFTYSYNGTKSLSLPLLYPIPNEILITSKNKLNELNETLNKNASEKKILNKYLNDSFGNIKYYEKFNKEIELNKIMRKPNSINELNNLTKDKENLLKYNSILRLYWSSLLKKKNNKSTFKFPIEDKELYSFPDLYNINIKYYNKPLGQPIYFIPNNNFSKIIQIYDFIQTFSHKIYINKFNLEELHIAIEKSTTYEENEIILLSSINISLIYILLNELHNKISLLDIYNNKDNNLLLIKILVDNLFEEDIKEVFTFISETWTELIRLILSSHTLNKFKSKKIKELVEKLEECKNLKTYNTLFNYDEKIYILQSLIYNCYETNFIRDIIKEEQEKRNEIKKNKKLLEENLKEIENKKRELERQEQFTQPQNKIEQINKKLATLSEDNDSLTRLELVKLRKSLEKERNEYKSVINEINKTDNQKNDILNKIEKIKNEIHDIPTVGKKFLGIDERGYKYFFFPWMNGKIYIKINKDDGNCKYEWRELNNETDIKDLIDKLNEKGIHESQLLNKLTRLYPKRMGYSNKKINNNTNDNNNLSNNNIIENEENQITKDDIFNKKILTYTNLLNPLKNVNKKQKNNTDNNKENISYLKIAIEKILDLEKDITLYLNNDKKEWESFNVRQYLIKWIENTDDIEQLVNVLTMFNERIKQPYKIDENENKIKKTNLNQNIKNKNIIDDDEEIANESENKKNNNLDLTLYNLKKEDIPIEDNNLDPFKTNKNLEFSGKIRFWNKEYENYEIENFYKEYLNEIYNNFPMLYISIYIFEVILADLYKRRDFYRKKNEDLLAEAENKKNMNVKIKDDEIEKMIIEYDNKNWKKRSLRNVGKKNYQE